MSEYKWIPCSERLPETRAVQLEAVEGQLSITEHYSMMSEYVLAQTVDPKMYVAMYEDDMDGRTYWETEDCAYLDVVAWMPLPTPYMEAEHEDSI